MPEPGAASPAGEATVGDRPLDPAISQETPPELTTTTTASDTIPLSRVAAVPAVDDDDRPLHPGLAPEFDESNAVPLRKQYLAVKRRYPEAIVLFRLGDFYETFDGDAEVLSRTVDVVLTSREMGKGLRIPMAGVPHHAAEGYIARLIQAGYKVAVCEQVGDVTRRGLVERDVTRVVTPGTVTDESLLDARTNNYLVAVIAEGRRAGLAVADITTGEFAATDIVADTPEEALLAIGRELLRIQPAEIVVPAGDITAWAPGIEPQAWLGERFAGERGLSPTDAWRWQDERARAALQQHFDVDSLDGFGCAGRPLAVRAAGGLLHYLQDTQLAGLRQITSLRTYQLDAYMTLDAQTRRNLELTESSRGDRRHSLVAVLDQTRTPMGSRLLRRWVGQPLLDRTELTVRQDGVQFLTDDAILRTELRQGFRAIGDIERLANRAVTGQANPRDLTNLRTSLRGLAAIGDRIDRIPGLGSLPDCSATLTLLDCALADEPGQVLGKGMVLRAGHASEIDEYRDRSREARDFIANLERTERDRTGIRTLKVSYNKVFGYYIEITTAALASAERDAARASTRASFSASLSGAVAEAPSNVLPDEYIARQTLANATRYFTPKLKEYETVVLTAEETLAGLESDAFRRVVGQVADSIERLLDAARTVAQVDVLSALAEVAVTRRYTRPRLTDGTDIVISQGRHPVLETVLPAGEYVPNDIHLDAEGQGGPQVVILTGPNMAGKSSYLRQAALICLLAQIGSFVSAADAEIGLVDRIFTRIGAQDDIATGQSTFMVEMLETANILNHATGRSLVVLDEIGRGTSTYDGLAIARAIVEYIHNAPRLGCRTLFATHYHELTELERVLPRIRAARMDVLEDGDQIVFLRQVVPGGADRSYGVHVAQLAGIPRAVVRRAEEILRSLESGDRADRTSGVEIESATAGSSETPGGRSSRRAAMRLPLPEGAEATDGTFQLTMFDAPNPVVDAIRRLDVDGMTPFEALTTLYELRRLTQQD
jgi:DNA mismatch repair protein MutS